MSGDAGVALSVRSQRLQPSRRHTASPSAHRRGRRGEILVPCVARLLHHHCRPRTHAVDQPTQAAGQPMPRPRTSPTPTLLTGPWSSFATPLSASPTRSTSALSAQARRMKPLRRLHSGRLKAQQQHPRNGPASVTYKPSRVCDRPISCWKGVHYQVCILNNRPSLFSS